MTTLILHLISMTLCVTAASCSLIERVGHFGEGGHVRGLQVSAGLGVRSASRPDRPAFCRNYDCPVFTESIVRQSLTLWGRTREYEHKIRNYTNPTTWVTTSLEIDDHNPADDYYPQLSTSQRRAMFSKLYRYIRGANDQNAQYPMTLPVVKKFSGFMNRTRAYPHETVRVTMMFYLTTPTPAIPAENDVTLVTLPPSSFNVRGFRSQTRDATAEAIGHNLCLLGKSTNANMSPQSYYTGEFTWYTAGYGPRYGLNRAPRYDEIWTPKLSPEIEAEYADRPTYTYCSVNPYLLGIYQRPPPLL